MNEQDRRGEDTPITSNADNARSDSPEDSTTSAMHAAGATSLESELARALEEIASLKDQLLRKAAEFENFRRRSEERQNDMIRYGAEKLITELLPVLDDFQRFLKAGQEHSDFEPFYKGVELLSAKLLKVLEQRGLKAIDAVGAPFDVEYHDALLQIPTDKVPPGTVIDEVEKGYVLHERVIRHSKVTVAAERPTE